MDLLIDIYGTRIGATGERIVLSMPKPLDQKKPRAKRRKRGTVKREYEKREYPIRRLDKIVILRPASLTTHAVRLALEHDVDIVYLGAFGKPIGRFFSSEPKGLATLRKAQLEASNDSIRSFELARTFVKGKCANQISHVRYLAFKYKQDFSAEILQMRTMLDSIGLLRPNSAKDDKSKEQLLGIEGYIADRYFHCLRRVSKFPGRIPQGRDKHNSMLNYGYGILYNEVERACLYVGLDPYLGLYHTEAYGKPALVLDLVEEFRVPLVDIALFPFFIDGQVGKRKLFHKMAKGEYQLSAEGKALVVEAVMKRLHGEVSWDGKRYTLKQVIEMQIRSLGRYFTGAEKGYQAYQHE
ncbi:MAG: CRISPR-associated endonuclease Cas1 [Patescibacteria group bacterium]|nr:CRISPR-associated endonuclease Cas1 [Patescibacteria group bacterium]MDE2116516.1 CRISPR-associated endonuclease Cas1 [Patescibacteria group bacterium]